MFLQVADGLLVEAAALPVGGVVPQVDRLQQNLLQAGLQILGRECLPQQVPVPQNRRQLGGIRPQLLQEPGGAEIGVHGQVLAQRRGRDRLAYVEQILLNKAVHLVGVAGFQKTAQNGGAHPRRVQPGQAARAAVLCQECRGFLGKDVLPGHNVAVGPQAG